MERLPQSRRDGEREAASLRSASLRPATAGVQRRRRPPVEDPLLDMAAAPQMNGYSRTASQGSFELLEEVMAAGKRLYSLSSILAPS